MPDEQVTDRFIGRDKEIQAFIQWLQDSHAPWILYFHDGPQKGERKGGVGKTWLLRECAAIVEKRYPDIGRVFVDFYNIRDRNRLIVVKRVIDTLKNIYPGWSPTSFTQLLEKRRITEDHKGITAPMSKNVEDYMNREELSSALAIDLERLDKYIEHGKKSLLIFLDSFETIEDDPVTAVLDPLQTFPDNYRFKHIGAIIAGRNGLNWNHPNWRGREQEVNEMPIALFSLNEMVEYINKDGKFQLGLQSESPKENGKFQLELQSDSDKAQALYARTQGRPIVLRLIIDALNDGTISFDELLNVGPPDAFESLLVPKIWAFESSMGTVVNLMAHIHHRFDQEMLELLLNEVFDERNRREDSDLNVQDLWKTVASLSFVRQAQFGGDITLHDEMRRLITEHAWKAQDPLERYRKSISGFILKKYYEDKIRGEQNQQKKQSYIVECLYHQLYVDIDKGLENFQEYFHEAAASWYSSFAHLLLLEAQKFESGMSVNQKKKLDVAREILQEVERKAEEARTIFRKGLSDKPRGGESHPDEANQPKYPEVVEVYYSYADEDIELLKQLQKQLAVLEQLKLIKGWDRGKIAAGEKVANRMTHLNNAHIILLCISPDFMVSEFTYVERVRALERYKDEKAIIIPVLFRPTGNWRDAGFDDLQALPRKFGPVTKWKDVDDAFDEIATEIRDIIDKIKK